MRDYKNVKVPKKYRTSSRQGRKKRVTATRAARRKGKRASSLKALVINVLVLAVVAGSGWLGWRAYRLMTHAQMFQIAGVDVKGVRHLNETELKNMVGVLTGRNIFSVDLEDVAARARSNPWVEDVRVYRRLPNRVSMTVVERVPVAVLDAGSGRYLIDADTVVIGRIATGDTSWRLPTIRVKGAQATPGEPETTGAVAEALLLLNEISARGGWKVSDVTIKADAPDTLSIVYASCEFKIGSGDYSEKLRRLVEVMADVQQRGLNVAYVDLRPERQVAVMMVKHGSSKLRGQGVKRRKAVPQNRRDNEGRRRNQKSHE